MNLKKERHQEDNMANLAPSTIQLIDPTGRDPGERPLILAPRPVTLSGKRLGVLDNSKANSDVILRTIAKTLNEQYEFSDIFYIKKHSASLPPSPEVMSELHRHVDVVITGVGD